MRKLALSGAPRLFGIGATTIAQSVRQFQRDSSPESRISVSERRKVMFRYPGHHRVRSRGDRSRPGRKWIDNGHLTDVLARFLQRHDAPVDRNRKLATQDQKKIGVRCTLLDQIRAREYLVQFQVRLPPSPPNLVAGQRLGRAGNWSGE